MVRLIFSLVLFLSSGLCVGQSQIPFSDFLKCEEQFIRSKISKDEYLSLADSLLRVNILKKGTTSTDTLIFLLNTFRKTAWSNSKYQIYRAYYFKYLSNNSEMCGRSGESIFYAGKYAEELEKTGKKDAFKIVANIGYLSRHENYREIIKIFESNQNTLKGIWDKARGSEFNSTDCKHAFSILPAISQSYLNTNDFKKNEQIMRLAEKLRTDIKYNNEIPPLTKVFVDLTCLYMAIDHSMITNNLIEAKRILQKSQSLLEKYRVALGASAHYHDDILKEHKIAFYTKIGDIDKAILQVDSVQKNRFEGHYETMITTETRGHLAAMQNDYKKGYDLLSAALKSQKKEYTIISTEMNALLYSHAEAESNRLELEDAEKQKNEQRNLTILITLFSALSIGIVLYFLNKEKRTSKKKVQELNRTANIEIEEVVARASKEERQKIGQDLHDGLSSSMAGILYHLEDIKIKTIGSELDTEVTSLYDKLQLVYKELREKSHVNFNALYDSKDDSLDESVQKIVNSALKNNTKREIEIDTKTSVLLDTSTRIEILRIVQEALTNIVKHAKKVTEVFVYLYENEGSVYLEIGNNGVISANKNSDGIGIRSIKSRVSAMGGESKIEYEGIGFKIEIKLPKPIHL